MPLEDKQARLSVMREIARYDMDTSLLSVKVINKVVYMDGRLRRNRGPNAVHNLSKALLEIEDTIKAFADINDVVNDVAID